MNESKQKRKILLLSDHALSPSGVGCQSRFLMEGLIKKGTWSVRQFGAALKHSNYDTIQVNPDFIIKPIDGFGNREIMIQTLVTEKPDVVIIFTDPRFFVWLYQIVDEIRDVCPLAYWHVWDNQPYPTYNEPYYESTDLINCHSYLTYEMIGERFPEKTNFIPHSVPDDVFYPLSDEDIRQHRIRTLGKVNEDAFVLFWANRNARRKRPADVIWAWSKFLKGVKSEGKKDRAILLMHTDPLDKEGPNLIEVAKHFDVLNDIVFSNQRLDFDKMNVLHNMSDACLNISYAEGFGLTTLEAMNCAKPIIAVKTGGLTRQVVDHRDESENGVAIDVDVTACVGTQSVPFIFEDYASTDNIAKAIRKIYDMSLSERKQLGLKARSYVLSEFSHQKTIDLWDEMLNKTIDAWKENKPKMWTLKEVKP
jgi:glycosyltransferase involved in cell wall biosynthesis